MFARRESCAFSFSKGGKQSEHSWKATGSQCAEGPVNTVLWLEHRVLIGDEGETTSATPGPATAAAVCPPWDHSGIHTARLPCRSAGRRIWGMDVPSQCSCLY